MAKVVKTTFISETKCTSLNCPIQATKNCSMQGLVEPFYNNGNIEYVAINVSYPTIRVNFHDNKLKRLNKMFSQQFEVIFHYKTMRLSFILKKSEIVFH